MRDLLTHCTEVPTFVVVVVVVSTAAYTKSDLQSAVTQLDPNGWNGYPLSAFRTTMSDVNIC